ncbi:hypothetical protein MMO38_08330 [Acinetobacter sp. NIPH 1852]|uniref:DUF4870 family protein n=1 Tax=Acinetobacter sp. NIPH 1852 TaxID=2923428 RepID=UPI001F4A5F70|nr:hypothetical protein [Acinetobacter sp. NIPH 1852]MCH7308148.1 hypothetical protein [Acinetobacter sp. NIPH 1852]
MNAVVDQKANRTLTYILYLFYILASVSAGVLAVLALIAIVLNYIKRKDMKGTLLESHFTWQIRTFWWYLFWNMLTLGLFAVAIFSNELGFKLTNDGTPWAFFAGLTLLFATWAWAVYRGVNGLFCLYDNQPMYQ